MPPPLQNGRFKEGAAVIHQQELKRVEAVGKNLFYMFAEKDGGPGAHVMHVHFGMSGRFSTYEAGSPGPDATPTTRLRLECPDHGLVAMLSAMTVDLIGGDDAYHARRAKLGQDPLREDADPDALWDRFRTLRKSVGLALMDQSLFAGVGNIYRAEILYKAGIHPEQPCVDITRDAFDDVWRHSVELLQRGFLTGSILTVDPEEAAVLGEPWTRRYVYNQSKCGRCGGRVKTWDMASRTVYCCERCQPKLAGTRLPEAAAERVKRTGKDHVSFASHCAPDGVGVGGGGGDGAAAAVAAPEKLTVAQLRGALRARGWPGGELKKNAKKAELVAALMNAPSYGSGGGVDDAVVRDEAAAAAVAARVMDDVHAQAAVSTPPATPATPGARASPYPSREDRTTKTVLPFAERVRRELPVPGIAGLEGKEATAAAAAAEKLAAGEKGNVEHIALADNASAALAAASKKRGKGRGGGGGASAEKPDTPGPSQPRVVRRRTSP